MRRRDFITRTPILAAAALTFPKLADAQQQRVIGFLDSGAPANMTTNLAGFRQGLGEMGFIEGQNVVIEYRWAAADYDRLPGLAADLVRRKVDVIAATRGPAPTLAAKAATQTIPIVFQSGGDPIKDGLVESLNRPGGNVTGASRLSVDLMPKRLGLLTDLKPKAATIALLVNRSGPQAAGQIGEIETASRALGLKIHVANASTPPELDAAFADIAQSHADALIVASDPLFIGRRQEVVELALRHGVPAIFGERESVSAGGLISYAASFTDSFRQVGNYVGRILKGAKPADLPVQQPVKFELIINLKTAKALGLEVPPKLVFTADEVIE